MKVGTKSLLFGAHQFAIHPIFVARGWKRLYGPARDPRLWIAFVIHDWGYFGKPNMDGPEGEQHVNWAADKMGKWFGPEWRDFCRYHSRFWAKAHGQPISRLCVADKQALLETPRWLYLFLVRLSGEEKEYKAARRPGGKYDKEHERFGAEVFWYDNMIRYLEAWVPEHKDLKEDTWTRALTTKQ